MSIVASLAAMNLLTGACFDPGDDVVADGGGSSQGATQGEPSGADLASTGAVPSGADDAVDTTGGGDETDEGTTADEAESTSSGGIDPDTGTDGDTGEETGSTGAAPVDEPPVAVDDGPHVGIAGQVLEVEQVDGILANDVDPEGSMLSVVAWDPMTVEGGMVVLDPATGGFSYLPPGDLPYGSDSFSYTVADEAGQTDTAEVRIVLQAEDGVVGLGELGRKGVRLQGDESGEQSGWSVAGGGDFNGDGYHDIVVGARYSDPDTGTNAGRTYLVHGGPALPPVVPLGTAVFVFEGVNQNDYSGHVVAFAGDVDGDTLADFLIGAPNAELTGSNGGESYLVTGGAALVSPWSLGNADMVARGVDSSDFSGWDLAGAGDVNGDGWDDIIIGAYGADEAGQSFTGASYLLFGGENMASQLWLTGADVRFDGIDSSDISGTSVSSAGDFNGDGYADLLIGAPDADLPTVANTGETYIIYGAPDLPAVLSLADADVRLDGFDASADAGEVVSGVGDVNGDGYDDVVVAAPRTEVDTFAQAGQSFVVYGGPAVPPVIDLAMADVRVPGVQYLARSGAALSGAGDFNGDGFADLLIGAAETDIDGDEERGEVYLILGGPVLPPLLSVTEADLRFEGISPDDFAGRSVSAAGDVDGDGYGDILIGAYGADPNSLSSSGETYLIFGDDITGTTTRQGTDLDDTLHAPRGLAADTLVAGRGDDIIYSDGGPDVIFAGQGDDTLVLADLNLHHFDGGLGTDTLALSAGVDLDLTAFDTIPLSSIEAIQLSPDGPTSLITSALDLLNLSETTNDIHIYGDADDVVWLDGGDWFGPVLHGDFQRYTIPGTDLFVLIHNDVTVQVVG